MTSFQTEMIYGFSIGIFAFTMVFSGRLIKKTGPLPLAILSFLLYFAVFFLASQSQGPFGILFSALGFVMGLAIGFGYVTPLNTAVRWFPQHKGFVTGIAVFGFGAWSMLTASLVKNYLIQGVDILQFFFWMGVIGYIVILASSLFFSPLRIPHRSRFWWESCHLRFLYHKDLWKKRAGRSLPPGFYLLRSGCNFRTTPRRMASW